MSFKLKAGDTLVIASHNPGKLREIRELIEPFGITAISAKDLGVPEPDETGATFEENARLKAFAAALATKKLALADDSGLSVDALGGAPGIYSARWAGEARDFTLAMQRVENELQAKGAVTGEARLASFICVLSLANPEGAIQSFEGRVSGRLVWPPRGSRGFGYDPMFLPDGFRETFGEMEPARKHAISHRARAFAAFKKAVLDIGEPG